MNEKKNESRQSENIVQKEPAIANSYWEVLLSPMLHAVCGEKTIIRNGKELKEQEIFLVTHNLHQALCEIVNHSDL